MHIKPRLTKKESLMAPLEIADIDLPVYTGSVVESAGTTYFLARLAPGDKRLGVLAAAGAALPSGFTGGAERGGRPRPAPVPADARQCGCAADALPTLRPVPLGLATSAGCGDRLGIATPGHMRAAQQMSARDAAHPIAMIFAQQSIREMTRTGRSPDDVMDDALWGAFQAGWRAPVGGCRPPQDNGGYRPLCRRRLHLLRSTRASTSTRLRTAGMPRRCAAHGPALGAARQLAVRAGRALRRAALRPRGPRSAWTR